MPLLMRGGFVTRPPERQKIKNFFNFSPEYCTIWHIIQGLIAQGEGKS
jgi:hypothetical protein